MTKILITGTAGFFGSHVLESVLDNTDFEVVCVDSLRHNGKPENLLEVVQDRWDRVSHISHDLTVPFSKYQHKLIGKIDYLINVASLCHVGDSIEDPVGFIQNNVSLMLTVLELCREKAPKHVVHLSTDEVFGPVEVDGLASASEIFDEVDGHFPSSPYAASKAAQEDIARSYVRTFDVPVTMVKSCNMFGERQSQLAFIPRIVAALMRHQPIDVHVVNGVPGKRNFVYARNVADRVLKAVTGHETRHVMIPGQVNIDNLSLVSTVSEVLNIPPKVNFVEARTVRPGHDFTYPDLGGEPIPGIEFSQALKLTVDWLAGREHAIHYG